MMKGIVIWRGERGIRYRASRRPCPSFGAKASVFQQLRSLEVGLLDHGKDNLQPAQLTSVLLSQKSGLQGTDLSPDKTYAYLIEMGVPIQPSCVPHFFCSCPWISAQTTSRVKLPQNCKRHFLMSDALECRKSVKHHLLGNGQENRIAFQLLHGGKQGPLQHLKRLSFLCTKEAAGILKRTRDSH
nr:hypothetical protein Iba_chr05cCG6350 [Ipomoea batatas]